MHVGMKDLHAVLVGRPGGERPHRRLRHLLDNGITVRRF
jgi:hypothetical protein